jgi:hypothetical protein
VQNLGRVQTQPVEINDMEVGALAGLDAAAVVKAEEASGLADLALRAEDTGRRRVRRVSAVGQSWGSSRSSRSWLLRVEIGLDLGG